MLAYVVAAPTRMPVIIGLFALLLVATVATGKVGLGGAGCARPGIGYHAHRAGRQTINRPGSGWPPAVSERPHDRLGRRDHGGLRLADDRELSRYRVMIGLTWLAATAIAATGLIGKREPLFIDTVAVCWYPSAQF